MKKIGFIGEYDKTDLLLNIAKVLTEMKNRVLIIDTTTNQKAKYIVPAINPTVSYITSFEEIDVAIGATKRGKYTFSIVVLFCRNVFDVALSVVEK